MSGPPGDDELGAYIVPLGPGPAVRTRFVTASGSVYEVDQADRMVRRLSGTAAPTPRQGPDGLWRSYAAISDPVVGWPVVILWGYDEDGVGKATTTSVVTQVHHLPVR